MLFFGRKKRLIDYGSAGRPGKLPDALLGSAVPSGGVYRLSDDLALLQCIDFFAPIVNVSFLYGQIAAAHAMSDLFAAGATPRTGLHLVAYPDDKDPQLTWLADILRGGAERFLTAGAAIAGGHIVRDAEIKFGYAVTGTVHPSQVITSSGARPGDKLVLTKALGTGIIAAAHKADACPEDAFEAASASMIQLNDLGRDAMREVGAHAAATVKGLGLAGHAAAMAEGSHTTFVLEVSHLPLLPGADKLARKPYLTRIADANAADLAPVLRKEGKVDSLRLEFAHDGQTSGGLLISVPAAEAEILVQKCRGRGAEATAIVGEVLERQDVALILRA